MNFLAHSLSSCDSAWHLARLLFTTLLLSVIPLQAAPLSGSRTIGPTGDYASITAAIADVQAQTLGGALILELESSYVSGVENFPLTIPALNGASSVNTVTLRPQAGAGNLVITSYDNLGTVALSGARFLIIDGRAGGTGTAKHLTFENNSASGVALRFINEASGNTLRHVTLQGSNTSATSGVVVFDGTSGANGNDNNTLEFCDVSGNGLMTPANCIYSFGVASIPAINNSGNTISNCNLFNFHANTGSNAAGVRLDDGNTDWIIAGNSFFQTTTRPASPSIVRPIYVNSPSGGNFTVTGNFIGGRAASAGGTAWTTSGTAAYGFVGIHLNVGTAAPSSVQGNFIRSIAWTSSIAATALPGVWCGIYVQAGSANVGTVSGNTIGSSTGTGSVSVTTSGNGGTASGIGSASSGVVAVANNTVGSITVNGTSTSISASLAGIQVNAGSSSIGRNIISSNMIGSATTANSLNAVNSSVSNTGQQVTGILISSNRSTTITGNTVANLNNNYAGTNAAGQIRGIVTSSGTNAITGNTVHTLSTLSKNAGTTTSASVLGISQTSLGAPQSVSQNLVHSLSNSATSAGVTVTGILYNGPTNGTNPIARNQVHSLGIDSASVASGMIGIQLVNGSFNAQNNLVRVGINAAGASTAGFASVFGILESGNSVGRNIHHNSVYVGGMEIGGANKTFAFQSTNALNERAIQNNIFINARSNSGSTGKHYAVAYGGNTANPTGLTAGGNIFLASGTGGVLGLYNNADRASLVAWQAATGQDTSSAVVDPLFVNPTGTAATVDLHLQSINPAESGAPSLTMVTDDFDGQSRTSPFADVGGDAGNFTLSSDVFAPGISYPLLTNGSTANRVLTGWASITDSTGISISPRLYYKKSTDADAFGVTNDSTGNGWKYVTATGTSSPYGFTIDYTLLSGGSVTPGDTIQYFVVAQDAANNLGSSPAGATASANPPVLNVNARGTVNSYTIAPSLSGTKTVGSGGDYPSLSGSGGLFAALNGSAITGDLVVKIVSDIIEDGSVGLNPINTSEYPQPFTLTIQPGSATMHTISGSAADGLIQLNGADRVTVDGRFGGSGMYLTFRNTSVNFAATTILFQNDSCYNTVRGCFVEGAETGSRGVISFRGGVVTGNDDNLITDCQIRDVSTGAGVPRHSIGSTGSSPTVANSGNTISNNELFNFNLSGIDVTQTGNESWTISGNNIYQVKSPNYVYNPVGISIFGGGVNLVTGNFIHDLRNQSSSIGIESGGYGTTTLSRNRITCFIGDGDIILTYFTGISARGQAGSTLNVTNNQITLIPAVRVEGPLGLHDQSTGGVINVFNNTIVIGGTQITSGSSWAVYRDEASIHTARNNIFFNLRTGGNANHYAAGNRNSDGSYTASHNLYTGTGKTPSNFMMLGNTGSTAVPVNFATWQTVTGDTNSVAGIAGSGDFTAALFNNAATGDLHLVPGGNLLVNATGVPIVGVADDFDGDPRSVSSPSIGSDEFPHPDIAVNHITPLVDGVSLIDFGTAMPGSGVISKSFTISNPGSTDLDSLSIAGATADFIVSPLSGTNIPMGTGTVTFTVNFNPTSSGLKTAGLQIISNVTGERNPFDIALQATVGVNFSEWAGSAGLTMENTSPAAMPYHDGIENLLKYAFNLNGRGPDVSVLAMGGTAGLPRITLVSTGVQPVLRVEYLRRKGSGMIYTPQCSSTLSGFETMTGAEVVTAIDSQWERVKVEQPATLSVGSCVFARVQVTLP